MSLAGLKKQFNKANQYVSQKIGNAKPTELDNDFNTMDKKTDTLCRLFEELTVKTQEHLQPNPASRAKILAAKSISKIRGQTSDNLLYPQPEGLLGDCLLKYGKEFGDDTLYGQSLCETGDSYKQLAEVKYNLEDIVRQNFLEPILQLQTRDLKELCLHKKKLQGRRLDYDCKKRKQEKGVEDDEIKQAEEKFIESKEITEMAMFNLLENESEQLAQLSAFVEAEFNYHQKAYQVLQSLTEFLKKKCVEATNRPNKEFVSKIPVYPDINKSFATKESTQSNGFGSKPPAIPPLPLSRESSVSKHQLPYCEALFDFDAENQGELGFKEGDKIQLLSHIDENWLEGTINGKFGYFPVTYVKIIIDVK